MVYGEKTSFFFFNDTATTEIYTLSLHDALPIWREEGWKGEREGKRGRRGRNRGREEGREGERKEKKGGKDGRKEGRKKGRKGGDRKSTRLNSSHLVISYAVFCLKKKKKHSTTSE